MSRRTHDEAADVISLPVPSPTPEPPPSRPGRAHGLAIAGMATSALVGIGAFFAFATIGWPEGPRRVLIGIFLFSILGFVMCASAAVFTAARGTKPSVPGG